MPFFPSKSPWQAFRSHNDWCRAKVSLRRTGGGKWVQAEVEAHLGFRRAKCRGILKSTINVGKYSIHGAYYGAFGQRFFLERGIKGMGISWPDFWEDCMVVTYDCVRFVDDESLWYSQRDVIFVWQLDCIELWLRRLEWENGIPFIKIYSMIWRLIWRWAVWIVHCLDSA